MARCGCSDSGACACFIDGGDGITVTGAGSEASHYVITAAGGTPNRDRGMFALNPADPGVDGGGARFLRLTTSGPPFPVGSSLAVDGSDDTILRTVEAGVYVASMTVAFNVATGNRGDVQANVHIDYDGDNASATGGGQMVADAQYVVLTSCLSWYSPANGKIQVAFVNGGGSHQDLASLGLIVQRMN